ncbi:MAG: PilZ domain-containing protein [Acidobacteriia bacterium]|nr:PilZ domain-containing protein [Terriglobia bacterium]
MSPTTQQQPDKQRSIRRSQRRYPIRVDLKYRILDGDQTVSRGSGRSVNLSSSGILFEADGAIKPGELIELALTWPARLNDKVGLTLLIVARTLREDWNGIAAVNLRYEFRTRALWRPAPLEASTAISRTIAYASSETRPSGTPGFPDVAFRPMQRMVSP